jgi:hypothetical protein
VPRNFVTNPYTCNWFIIFISVALQFVDGRVAIVLGVGDVVGQRYVGFEKIAVGGVVHGAVDMVKAVGYDLVVGIALVCVKAWKS